MRYCGSSVVMNETSDRYQPCSSTLPCSMSHAISKSFDSSEFSGYVRDICRYATKSSATASTAAAAASRRADARLARPRESAGPVSPPAGAAAGSAEDFSGVPLLGTAATTSFGLGIDRR